MSVVAIVLIVVAGIVLLLIEFLVIPGVSVFGIAGFLCLIGGVLLCVAGNCGHITPQSPWLPVLSMLLASGENLKKMGRLHIDSRIVTI
jgi:membrane-bound ClpP family serine protease